MTARIGHRPRPLLAARALALLALLLGLLLTVSSAPVRAHELSMAEMQLRELSRGEFLWQWTASGNRGTGEGLVPRWPDGCVADAQRLRCGAAGLRGSFSVEGVGDRYSAALIKVFWLDGQTRVYTLTGGQPKVQLHGAADDSRGGGEIAVAYAGLGIEHILSGFDHLCFVVALMFLVGFQRRLVLTITAFTLAHSVTLALGVTGWLTLRPPPVEATIALSIMLVAGEALRSRETLSRRWPALVAFLFGLVHGLGFAGALQEVGLPDRHLWLALLTFNLGVEVGQLMAVAVAWLAYRSLRGRAVALKARWAALYGIGALSAYWSIARMSALLA